MKIKLLVLCLIICALGSASAQGPLIDYNGTATFFSEAPLEDIDAVNKQVMGAIDLNKGTVAVSMFIKGFHFDKSLMEEHFNENYLESDKYPKATYKGNLLDFLSFDFTKPGAFEIMADGEMEIHGVKKPLKVKVNFEISNAKIVTNTSFDVAVADFNIEIPKLVFQNIAEVVAVKAFFNFSKPQ